MKRVHQIIWKCCLALVLTFPVVSGQAQQQAMYTQYMFNGLVLNPAYAGSQETFTATGILRRQWVGIQGAPETQTFSAHSPLDDLRNSRRPGNPVSLGLTVFNDRIAVTDQSGLLGSYAYRVQLANGGSLSFGLQGGFSHLRIRYSQLELDDPAFAVGDISRWQPEFGAGIYYQAKRFYTGLSAPQMLRSEINPDGAGFGISPHYFFTMGYLVEINSAIALKPNLLIKKFYGNIIQFDLNCNLFLKERVNLGVSWRSMESIGTMLQVQVHPRFALGYAFDIPCGSEWSTMNSGSHEIMVSYRVPKKKRRIINPRFF